MHWLRHTLAAAALIALSAGAASAQVRETTPVVSTSDIQRLQDMVYDTGADIARLGDDSARERLDRELDDLRDEVVYLKVKQRKQGTLSRSEYTDVRDRLQELRTRVRSGSNNPWTPNTGVSGGVDEVERGRRERQRDQVGTSGRPTTARSRNEVPAGQELDVRLERELSSKTAQVEDRFTATTLVDVRNDERMLIPAGSVVRGIVTSVDRATRVERKGKLTVSFDQITIDGRTYPIRATVVDALESEGIRGEAAKIGAGAGVGAIIGGILGGMKGAIAGILIGGGGTIAATEGTDVELTPGTVLRVRLDSPMTVR
jgi:hypothetical protein